MKRLIACTCLLGFVFAFSSVVLGDPMALDDRWDSGKNPKGSYNYPFSINYPDSAYKYGPPTTGYHWDPDVDSTRLLPHPGTSSDWQLAHNDSVVFAMENQHVDTLYKTVVLRIFYHGDAAGMLTVADRGHPQGLAKTVGEPEENVTEATVQLAPGKFEYTFKAYYFPQPSWEWYMIKNVGRGSAQLSVTIDSVEFVRECRLWDQRVPSLTQWGMIGLGVLILAAGAMVIVQRRKATARA